MNCAMSSAVGAEASCRREVHELKAMTGLTGLHVALRHQGRKRRWQRLSEGGA